MTARLLLWMVMAVWSLFALTLGAIHLVIVPRIDDWRPAMERWATRAVGVPVKVGEIRAETQGADANPGSPWLPALMPAFELRDVRLFDPTGREALHLPQINATLSVRSLWRLGFEQLVIQSPTLDVRRTADHRILVAGLDFSGPADRARLSRGLDRSRDAVPCRKGRQDQPRRRRSIPEPDFVIGGSRMAR